MAKGFIAIDLEKNVHEFSEKGIVRLKELHARQGITGWQYGNIKKLDELKSKVVTQKDAPRLLEEVEKLKAELEKERAKKVTKNKSAEITE